MYGREKIAVVKPTNAVSATRNTLKESIKKSLPATSSGPSVMTRTVSAIDASQVRRLTATLTRDAQARSPIAASSSAPASGKTSTARVSIIRLLALTARSLAASLDGRSAMKRRVSAALGRPAARPSGLGSASPRPPRSLALLELLEVLQVEAVELLPDLKEEHAEDQHAHQHVERD